MKIEQAILNILLNNKAQGVAVFMTEHGDIAHVCTGLPAENAVYLLAKMLVKLSENSNTGVDELLDGIEYHVNVLRGHIDADPSSILQ